jgi:hypothetical protein
MHEGDYRSAPCQFCGRIFCSGFSLKRHVASVHRGQMAAAVAGESAAVAVNSGKVTGYNGDKVIVAVEFEKGDGLK